jgi:3-methyladenine DNA glycosylase AlkD
MSHFIVDELKNFSEPEKAKVFLRFFKTQKGEYGEGDKFLGVIVPDVQKIAQKYFKNLNYQEIQELLESEFHEIRLLALLILIRKYSKADENEKKDIYDLYLKNTKYVNNWDLVDVSARKIVGNYLLNFGKNRNVLYKLAISKNLWERRIAIISTHEFILNKQYEDTFNIAKILINDQHDLIHKAVG